jgi:hypothetical protein
MRTNQLLTRCRQSLIRPIDAPQTVMAANSTSTIRHSGKILLGKQAERQAETEGRFHGCHRAASPDQGAPRPKAKVLSALPQTKMHYPRSAN